MQLALENVFFRRDEFFIENLSISISSGFTVITGRSGSGKTTLLSLLSGLEKPDKGSLILDGIVQHSFISRCGVIFQHPERQLFAETVFKDVSFALCSLSLISFFWMSHQSVSTLIPLFALYQFSENTGLQGRLQ